MCGIAGLYHLDGRPVDAAVLERMRRVMPHRGPDDRDVWIDGSVGLAHNRLAILDLSERGHQPMRDPELGSWIVYNGEIYNFLELRRELEARGCVFRSKSDTEVLLGAYREFGPDCLERMNGMFAFAIFDPRRRELFLARDRMGIKPLYFVADARRFAFASETKALLQLDRLERRVDRSALPELLAFRHLVGGRTLFEGVRELEPGHALVVGPGGTRSRRYWDIPAPDPSGAAPATLDALEETLRSSVRYQLIADVPVGCALSGGVDSSLVTALACEMSPARMVSFSIGFDDASCDERPHAREIAGRLEIENQSRELGQAEFFARLPLLTWHLDEPINHPNSVGIWLLAGLARERVVVLLSGEGGDELFGGYQRFRRVLRLRSLRTRLPGVRALARVAPRALFPARFEGVARDLARDDDGLLIWSSAMLPSPYLDWLFGPGACEQAEVERRALLGRAPALDPIARHLYYELRTYLVSLLMRIDKMCMAHSLENRVPLLDHRVVEQAFRLPTGLRVGRDGGKVALRHLVERRFGAAPFARRKMGFGLPRPYFEEAGLAYLRKLATGQRARERGLLDPAGVARVFDAYEAGGELTPDSIWMLGMLELWARTFLDAPGQLAEAPALADAS
jgi:asparagine synthase (glutamine-hydrolysing)